MSPRQEKRRKQKQSGHTRGIMFQTQVNYRGLEIPEVPAELTFLNGRSTALCAVLNSTKPTPGMRGQALPKRLCSARLTPRWPGTCHSYWGERSPSGRPHPLTFHHLLWGYRSQAIFPLSQPALSLRNSRGESHSSVHLRPHEQTARRPPAPGRRVLSPEPTYGREPAERPGSLGYEVTQNKTKCQN